MKNSSFQTWFEQREANGCLRCDNIYDTVDTLAPTDVYDFVESMMLVAWSAGITHALESVDL